MKYYIIKYLIARARTALSFLELGNEAQRTSSAVNEFADALQSAMINEHRKKLDETRIVTLVGHRKN